MGTINGREFAEEYSIGVKNDTVKIDALDDVMKPVFPAIASAVENLGLPRAVITSGNDSSHSHGSLHFQDRALDLRGNNIPDAMLRQYARHVAVELGDDFDVLFEIFPNRPPNDHLHIEYDPD